MVDAMVEIVKLLVGGGIGGSLVVVLLRGYISRIPELERRIEGDVERRLDSAEKMAQEFRSHQASCPAIQQRLASLERRWDDFDPGAIAAKLEMISRQVAAIDHKLDAIATETTTHRVEISNLTAFVNNLHQKARELGQEIAQVRDQRRAA